MTNVVLNGNAYSDDGTSSRDMQGGGHRQWLLPMLGDSLQEVQQTKTYMAAAGASALAAAGSEAVASSAAIAAHLSKTDAAASESAAEAARDAAVTASSVAVDAAALATAVGPGWTPVLALQYVGQARVAQVTDFVGGVGGKPTTQIGMYLGPAGYVPDPADATDLRGPEGPVGEGARIHYYDYESRGSLRSDTSAEYAAVESIGLLHYVMGSDEPDDDESCFVTAAGRWLLAAAHWDLIDAWQLPEVEESNDFREDEPLRWDAAIETSTAQHFAAAFDASFDASFDAKIITGSATCAITSVASVSSVSFTGTVTGAAIGDRVVATPPAELGGTAAFTGRLGCYAFVDAPNSVTVMLTNASAATATTNAAVRAAWPITVIKP